MHSRPLAPALRQGQDQNSVSGTPSSPPAVVGTERTLPVPDIPAGKPASAPTFDSPGYDGSSSLRAFRALQRAITTGAYGPGSRMPAERALAAEIGASRTSIRQALQALADSGLIFAAPYRGWFVADASYSEGPNALRSFTEAAAERGLTAGARLIRSTIRPATLDEADQLGLPPTAPLLELARLRTMGDMPICLSTSRISRSRAGELTEVDLTDKSLFQMLEQVCGIVATRCRYEISAVPAGDEVADLLAIAPQSPVLIGTELFYDEQDLPVMLGLSTYRGDAYRFQATLFRS